MKILRNNITTREKANQRYQHIKFWLKEMRFKTVIAAALLIVGFAAAYFYTVFLPAQEEKKAAAEFRQQEKCREIGSKVHQENLKSFGSAYSMFEPHYTFNKKLNTCLYSSGIVSKEGRSALEALFDEAKGEAKGREPLKHWERWVKDVLTNETILQVSSAGLDSENEDVRERANAGVRQYFYKHDELFSL